MKYLLDFLSTVPDAPTVQDGEFQQLIVDVHAGKSQSRSNDQFYESLEKIVNELRSTPEALIFLKPVSKKDAPDYADVIKHPMDLSTVLRNVKAQKYKNKASFERDLDLIWENCLIYNSEGHPLRATAKYMRQKAEHHCEFLQDRIDRRAGSMLNIPGLAGSPAPSASIRLGSNAASRGDGTGGPNGTDEDEDAAGEDEDGDGEAEDDDGLLHVGTASVSRAGSAPRAVNGTASLPFRDDRPNLTPNLDNYPALTRTSFSMIQSLPSFSHADSAFTDKGKARDPNPAPAWYPPGQDTDEDRIQGSWWATMSKDEAYTGGLPTTVRMSAAGPRPQKRLPTRKRRLDTLPNGSGSSHSPPTRMIRLENVIHRTVDELTTARHVAFSINDWQKAEADGGILPPIKRFEREKELRKEEEAERREARREEAVNASKRRKLGGEVGEQEAALACKRATAGMLAHAGFDGANEAALDLFTRMSTEHMRNMGKTFRLLLDGFSKQMSSEEITLHALFENGLVRPYDLESHIRDEIEREGAKISEMTRKVKQAYSEVTTAPVIEDDMMFADSGEMLTDGNFADELGEDFLGLRNLGVAREHGMTNLTIPTNLFYGRKKRNADPTAVGKTDTLDYALPPPLIPLSPTTYTSQLPALLHAFFAARIEAGLGLEDDPTFDPAHAIIGSLGQVSVKPLVPVIATKKKSNVATAAAEAPTAAADSTAATAAAVAVAEKKKVAKKVIAGVGKGNWIRPGKEEKAKRAASKSGGSIKGSVTGGGSQNGTGEEEDAEGEEG